tara:strand:+ start:3069 stop:3359 length:291 start_codon:yes stop_codon:yes gene_type:complete
MYYRLTHATIQSGTYDEAMATMKTIRDKFNEINGLLSSRLVRISENEIMGIAVYESQELLEASQTKFNEIMSSMGPYLAGPPTISYGEQVMAFDAE